MQIKSMDKTEKKKKKTTSQLEMIPAQRGVHCSRLPRQRRRQLHPPSQAFQLSLSSAVISGRGAPLPDILRLLSSANLTSACDQSLAVGRGKYRSVASTFAWRERGRCAAAHGAGAALFACCSPASIMAGISTNRTALSAVAAAGKGLRCRVSRACAAGLRLLPPWLRGSSLIHTRVKDGEI